MHLLHQFEADHFLFPFAFSYWPAIFDIVIPRRLKEVEILDTDKYVNELVTKNILGYVQYNKRCIAAGISLNEKVIDEVTIASYQDYLLDKLNHWKDRRAVAATASFQEECDAQIKIYERCLDKATIEEYYYCINDLWCENSSRKIDTVGEGESITYYNTPPFKEKRCMMSRDIIDELKARHKYPERYVLQLIQNDCMHLFDSEVSEL